MKEYSCYLQSEANSGATAAALFLKK